jgi:hypothetical protein
MNKIKHKDVHWSCFRLMMTNINTARQPWYIFLTICTLSLLFTCLLYLPTTFKCIKNRSKQAGHGGIQLQSQHLGGWGRRIKSSKPIWATWWHPLEEGGGGERDRGGKREEEEEEKEKTDSSFHWWICSSSASRDVFSTFWMKCLCSYQSQSKPLLNSICSRLLQDLSSTIVPSLASLVSSA